MTSLVLEPGVPQTIEAVVGESLAVTLRETGTTGFVWRLDEPAPPIISADEGEVLAGDAHGASGERTFHVEIRDAGEVTLIFRLARAWQLDQPVESATLKVVAS